MTDWIVEIRHGNGTVAKIALIDDPGPLNSWKSLTPNALIPESGSFLNQLRKVSPSVQPSWELRDFDIDEDNGGRQGEGEVFDNPSPPASFPTGPIEWSVIGKYDGSVR